MPRGRRPAGRGKAKQSPWLLGRPEVSPYLNTQPGRDAPGHEQQVAALEDSDHRPRTRAWHKARAEKQQKATAVAVASITAVSLTGQPQARVSNNSGRPLRRGRSQGITHSLENSKAAPSNKGGKRVSKIPETQPEQKQGQVTLDQLYSGQSEVNKLREHGVMRCVSNTDDHAEPFPDSLAAASATSLYQ